MSTEKQGAVQQEQDRQNKQASASQASQAKDNPGNPEPKTQAELRGEKPPVEDDSRVQERQAKDSPEERARKSVAQGAEANLSTEETELSASRSRTQNPAGGHTPDQLIHERKSDL